MGAFTAKRHFFIIEWNGDENANMKKNDEKKINAFDLREKVYKANLRLQRDGLSILTWGNVSGIDRERGVILIKPSGVPYETMRPEDIVTLNLEGEAIEGDRKPSSDTPTHVALYKAFPNIGAIVHTHSPYAVAFAQAKRDIPPYGTTHADAFFGPIPCSRDLTKEEIEGDYEANTGKLIVETFRNRDYEAIPGALIASHGAFVWGKNPEEALDRALILEEVAKMAVLSERLNPNIKPISKALLDKHYNRKHGKKAYYGQPKKQ